MLESMLAKAKTAQRVLAATSGQERNRVLTAMAALVLEAADAVLAANQEDVAQARAEGLSGALLKRLELDRGKLRALAEGLEAVARLPDPLGRGQGVRQLDNGLRIEAVHVPLGVVGLIFESRPGVALEAVGLTVKSGNAIILRGGHEALHSNRALVGLWRQVLEQEGLPQDAVQLIDSPDRQWATALMHLRGLDLLIPRGGAGLIETVVREATVPVIETGVGNCHLYVHAAADLDMAVHILRDGKVGNPAVCNALETVLVDRAIAREFLPRAWERLSADGVVFHGDAETCALIPEAVPATEDDWRREYLSLDLAVRVVSGPEAAIDHIARYGTGHSEAIVTNDYAVGQAFLKQVDAAVVYWNASTRFTDGFQFGLGAEVGISTQKLHARGPMGLEALTTIKTLAYGQGQTRDL
ncbi:MAG: glutamate-5-semialdehyde dehydrogenase [Firmicutes bacterium]|nr:glutamate-5-semialdehyde dehydrogenase [Alicyclobacillaceae bacterium]MCL6498279.1 glutamate-5-semialdehyde dehydrogenase [Bacillota bacterium]